MALLLLSGLLACDRAGRHDGTVDDVRRMNTIMVSVARGYEVAGVIPPDEGFIETDSTDLWGMPLRVEYYRGKPVLRSAGPDREYYTDSDIIVTWKVGKEATDLQEADGDTSPDSKK